MLILLVHQTSVFFLCGGASLGSEDSGKHLHALDAERFRGCELCLVTKIMSFFSGSVEVQASKLESIKEAHL